MAMEILRQRYEVKVWQWILTWLVMLTLMIGGVIGVGRYAADQREQSRRDNAIATYQATVATYQNALSDRGACLARAQGRADIAVLLDGIYDKIDPDNTDATVNELRGQLENFKAEATTGECPAEPTAPEVPKLLLNGGG